MVERRHVRVSDWRAIRYARLSGVLVETHSYFFVCLHNLKLEALMRLKIIWLASWIKSLTRSSKMVASPR